MRPSTPWWKLLARAIPLVRDTTRRERRRLMHYVVTYHNAIGLDSAIRIYETDIYATMRRMTRHHKLYRRKRR